MSGDKTGAKRQASYRQRMLDAGFVRLTFWVRKPHKKRIEKYIKILNGEKEIETPEKKG